MADDPDVLLFHRLLRHRVVRNVATVVVSSGKLFDGDLEDWAIEALGKLKPHDAIGIIRNISFGTNTGKIKSKILCSNINKLKSSSQDASPAEKQNRDAPNRQGEESFASGGCGGQDTARGNGGQSSARGRGGPSSARGRGGPSSARGRGDQSSARGRGDHSSTRGREGQSSARGRGDHSSARGRGGQGHQIIHNFNASFAYEHRPPPPRDGLLPLPRDVPRMPPPRTGFVSTPPLMSFPARRSKGQQELPNMNKYLNTNLDHLKNLSESASGITNFCESPNVSEGMVPEDVGRNRGRCRGERGGRSGNRSRRSRWGNHGFQTQDTDEEYSSGDNGSDFGSTSKLDCQATAVKGLNKNFFSTGDLSRGGPRGGRGRRGTGNHDNSVEIVDIDIDGTNAALPETRQGHERGRGRGRGNRGGRQRRPRTSRGGNKDLSQGDEEEEYSGSDSNTSGTGASFGNQEIGSRERLKDFDNQQKQTRRPHARNRSDSQKEESERFEDERVNENELFSYLVKSCNGFIGMDEFKTEHDIVPDDLDTTAWFRGHKRRFKLFEKKGDILYVSAFYRDVTICLNYNGLFGRNKPCNTTKCEHFHICKDYVSGNCSFGEKCNYSHSFRDENNLEHKKTLGLNMFSDKDMVIILRNRYPKACSDFLKTASCTGEENCPNLHICSLDFKRKCPNGRDCPRGHSFDTDHNRWVLESYECYGWVQKAPVLLKKLILVDRSIEAKLCISTENVSDQEINEDESLKAIDEAIEFLEKKPISRANRFRPLPDDPDGALAYNLDLVDINRDLEETKQDPPETAKPKPKRKRQPSKSKNDQAQPPDVPSVTTTWLEDTDQPICVKCLEGKCQRVCPKSHHHLPDMLPYLWQMKQGTTWCCFAREFNEEIETGFCECLEVIDAEILVESAAYMVHVCVGDANNPEGVVYEHDGVMLQDPERFPMRRLSTESYVEVKDKKTPGNANFATQWRWYWKNDGRQWIPFETDEMQKTLESKYKFGQPTYHFTRENYKLKYRVDFRTFRQVNLDTKMSRDLCRRPLFVSQEDVKSTRFPTSLDVREPMVRPVSFAPWDLSSTFELVELERVKPEFKEVRDSFFGTLDRTLYNILNIYRVQNWQLYQSYEQRKRTMLKEINMESDSRDVNEMILFHGTDSMGTCQAICTNNFDYRTSGKNATAYGEGSYFANTSKYSHRYATIGKNGQRLMFRAKVLVGLYAKGHSSYRRPPEIPGQKYKLYDSCVDNQDNPSMYIIFERSQSYPEYLIAYREISTLTSSTLTSSSAIPAPQPAPRVTTKIRPPVPVPVRPVTLADPASRIPPQSSRPTYASNEPVQRVVNPVESAYPYPTTPQQSNWSTYASNDPTTWEPVQRVVSPVEPGGSIAYPYPTTSQQSSGLVYPVSSAHERATTASSEVMGSVSHTATRAPQGNHDSPLEHLQKMKRAQAAADYAANMENRKTIGQKKKDDGCVVQ